MYAPPDRAPGKFRRPDLKNRLPAQVVQTQVSQTHAGLAPRSSSIWSQQSEFHRVRNLANTTMNKEHKFVYPGKVQPLDRRREIEEAFDTVESYYEESDGELNWQWKDLYFDTPITRENSRLSASVEAKYPLVEVSGRPREHIASNMCVTRLYGNILLQSNPPIGLKALHELDMASRQGDAQTVNNVIDFIDNLHVIRSQVPWSTQARLDKTYTVEFLRDFANECETGIATLDACARIQDQDAGYQPYLWRIRMNKSLGKSESTLAKIHEVKKFIEDVQDQAGVRFPAINEVPYPFRGGPNPADWSWAMIYAMFQPKLAVLKRKCNKRHIATFDVPRLICVVFYLLCHGSRVQKHQTLELPCSIYVRHLLALSIGKDDHAAGMTTGLEEGNEISLANLDIDAINICVEPWCGNAAKGNRESDTEAMRDDFRANLKKESPGFWSEQLPTINPGVKARYITNGTATSFESDAESGSAGASSPGERGGDLQPPMTRHRNMHNLSQTCDMSTVLQCLHNNPDIRAILREEAKLLYKAQTGRSDAFYLPFGENADYLDPEQMGLIRQSRIFLQKAPVRTFAEAVRRSRCWRSQACTTRHQPSTQPPQCIGQPLEERAG